MIVVVLHRDLRADCHPALERAAELGGPVLPIIVLPSAQKAALVPNRFAFLVATLHELQTRLRGLVVLQPRTAFDAGSSEDWIRLLRDAKPRHILTSWDRSLTEGRARAEALEAAAATLGCGFEEIQGGVFLTPFAAIRTQQAGVYRVFTPYRDAVRAWLEANPPPSPAGREVVFGAPPPEWGEHVRPLPEAPMRCGDPAVRGGHAEAERLLRGLLRGLGDYAKRRDEPHRKTSLLGAHLHHGTVSVRDVWRRVSRETGTAHPLLDQLIWREWFAYRLHYTQQGEEELLSNPALRNLAWADPAETKRRLALWKAGRTGVPLVDAGMRQLERTGWLGNRLRMVTADYLVKILRVPWREGERHFARHLIDFDESSNLGSWDWIVTDLKYGRPRVFNPTAQARRFDPEAVYVKAWIPELRPLPVRTVLRWAEAAAPPSALRSYPAPAVDYATAAAETRNAYEAVLAP